MKKIVLACLLLSFLFLQSSVEAQDLHPSEGPTVERRNRSNKADLLIVAFFGALKAICDKTGKCPFAIVDKAPIYDGPAPSEEPGDYRRQLSPSTSASGTTGTESYSTFRNGDSIAIGPVSQYTYDPEKRTYDLLNGVWVNPAKRNSSNLNEEMRPLMDGILKANPYITFQNIRTDYVAGNSCLASNYSGVHPRTGDTESGVTYVCQKGAHKLYFVTVASGPDRARYERENQLVIQKITVQ